MVFRELTKINEELVIRPNKDDSQRREVAERGEFTIIIGPYEPLTICY
jgi:16S rRNA C1402 (ribose-2'-O) methylase RsmI